MKKIKNSIAISVYDKFEEIKLLVDIIRENWEQDYIITVCCNHPDGERELSDLAIDSYVQGDPIPYYTGKSRINKRYRVIDCIRKDCTSAISFNSKTVMHLHSDAWPLDEKKYLSVIESMYKRNALVALRGFGHGFYPGSSPLGHIDDMFFVVDTKFAKKVDLFDIRPLALLPHLQSIHGMLNTVFLGKVGLDRIYHYDDHQNTVLWSDKNKIMVYQRGRPVNYDIKTGFLHLDRGSFPEKYGKHIQAIYLKNGKLTKGKYLKDFIATYYRDPNQVFAELNALEKKLNWKLQLLGFDPKYFGQEYVNKIDFLKQVTPFKITKNLLKRLTWPIAIRLVKYLKIPSHHFKSFPSRDGFWPLTIKEYYKRELEREDYANASDEFWFDK